ncbi:MAG: hypothetical protein JO192_00030 [Candidatus Eremiobacteraeota bacterium]|nr:hypothetical protein [Candidatus Eremiobacteraeota bacterium]MBV8721937.1 hypothetical protein [Candidatus Eremiobacteraeota bacterium]
MTPARKRLWKRAGIVAGVLFGIWVVVEIWLAGGGPAPPPPSSVSMNLQGGHVVTNRITTKSWTFDYEHAQLSPDGLTGSVDGVRNGVVFRKGKPYLKISAEHVQLDIESLDFTAVGKVQVERIDDPAHRSFDTDLVTWTNNAKLLHMDHPVYVHSGDQTLRIDGITVDFDENTIHFGKLAGGVEIKH